MTALILKYSGVEEDISADLEDYFKKIEMGYRSNRRHPDEFTIQMMANRLGISYRKAEGELNRMLQEGKVIRREGWCERGKKMKLYKFTDKM